MWTTAWLVESTLFLCVHIDQAVAVNSSRLCWCLMSQESSSLKSINLVVSLQAHADASSQTTLSSLHVQSACRVVSVSSLHRSQIGFSMMVWRTRLSLVGKEFRHALQMWFFILFGVCRAQMAFQRAFFLFHISFSTSTILLSL